MAYFASISFSITPASYNTDYYVTKNILSVVLDTCDKWPPALTQGSHWHLKTDS
jgi:hypothetical protein